MRSPSDPDASLGPITLAIPSEDPMRSLSAAEIGAALGGIGEEAVRARERSRELFSIIRPGRSRHREYPVFQVWPSVTSSGLKQVLDALRPLDATDLYGFFAERSDLLGSLTPVETLTGRLSWPRITEQEADTLLMSTMPVRLKAVLAAAQALVALRAG